MRANIFDFDSVPRLFPPMPLTLFESKERPAALPGYPAGVETGPFT